MYVLKSTQHFNILKHPNNSQKILFKSKRVRFKTLGPLYHTQHFTYLMLSE